jgi:hypothetical protein
MRRRFASFAIVAAIVLAGGAHGQNDKGYAPVSLAVACGPLTRADCGKVLPAIGSRTALAGLELRAMDGGGALGAIGAVCLGQIAAAIVPRDVAARMAREPDCRKRYAIVGRPLFPLYALLVVKAGAPFRQLSELTRIVATDAADLITLELMAPADPPRREAAADFEAVSQRIADGSIDGWFSVRPLMSDLIDRIRLKTDARGSALFRFIDVRARPDASRETDDDGNCLHRRVALDFGGAEPVTTVSTDAVIVLGVAFRDAHARGGPRAAEALASAIDAAATSILAETKSPRDWRPTATSCH